MVVGRIENEFLTIDFLNQHCFLFLMTLYFIGIGLCDEKDISVKGLEIVKKADVVYLENYTSVLLNRQGDKLYGREVILADREMVEQNAEKSILKDADKKNVAFLVVGDPFAATTHTDLLLRAKKLGIKIEVLHNASIMSAIGITGLQVYKFGKTTSIPFSTSDFQPETPYDVVKMNKKNGLHTLVLLDLKKEEKEFKFLTAKEGMEYLLKIEDKRKEEIFTKNMKVIIVERLGCSDFKIYSDTVEKLLKKKIGKPLHALIVPGQMHFMEEEVISSW